MKYDSDLHHRRSIRLKGYDYSQNGFYFITVCTQNHECLFGSVGAGSKPALSDYGQNIAVSTSVTIQNINKRAESNKAGLEPAPTENALNIEYSLFAQNTRAGLEPTPTKSAINIAYLTHAPTKIKTISETVLNLKIFFVDENRVVV